MGKVYITNESRSHNYLPAEQFGTIEFLTADDFSSVASSLLNPRLVHKMRTKLTEFDPKRDFIVPSGSPIVTGVAFMLLREVLQERGESRFTVLRWSKFTTTYEPIVIDLSRSAHYG